MKPDILFTVLSAPTVTGLVFMQRFHGTSDAEYLNVLYAALLKMKTFKFIAEVSASKCIKTFNSLGKMCPLHVVF